MTERIVVVGASLAGVNAAHSIRRAGFEGEVVLVGAESHRPYDRPPLSKEFLTGDHDVERIVLRPVANDSLDVTWRLGARATALDLDRRRLTIDDTESLDYDGLVIATGATASDLPARVGHRGLEGVHLLRTLDHAQALKAALVEDRPGGGPVRVVVCGAGFIGAEVAAAARSLGAEVTMVDVASVPLERVLDPEVGSAVADLHRRNGVDLRLEAGVEAVGAREADGVRRVSSVSLGGGESLEADVLVVGIGVRPATEWVEGSGLTIDNGIVVDENCRAAPGVVVAGDVARWPNPAFDGRMMRIEQWDNAVDQGGYVGRRLLADLGQADDPGPFAPVPWFWSDQYDAKIQLAGITDGEPEMISGSVGGDGFVRAYVGEDDRVVGVLCWNKPRQAILGRRLIGERGDMEAARAALG